MRTILTALISLCLLATAAAAETFGVRRAAPRPEAYGRVVMDNHSRAAKIAPVVFDHWNHRLRYTCRLCHVDLGFALVAGETDVREADNRNHRYCGACHDGKEAFGWLRSERGHTVKQCDRCHSLGRKVVRSDDFDTLTRDLPHTPYGNHVDWVGAEREGKIHLKDALPGITRVRRPIRYEGETVLHAREFDMPDILFSHRKHAVWNGCELCHPSIFGVARGATRYTMQEIFDGRYCGACHGKVSFPVDFDCRLCHTKDVF
ncbi:MAG: hypothetical protein D6739_07595 [Nitrospirae bacterium]|nr:MAG: hypothetical protein D6739_07595 [Nitrospirota bacterium]